jgi:Mg-chelatase subunit ChlD
MWPFTSKADIRSSNLQSNKAGEQPATDQPTPFTPTSSSKIQHLIILDASGSMESIKQAAIKGFNEVLHGIIQGQQLYPEVSNMVSLVIFNSSDIRKASWIQPVSAVRDLDEFTYLPNGGTPLLDAIGVSVTRLEEQIGYDPETRVVVNIITDGEENASSYFNHQDIKNLIGRLTERGWIFTFIGANQDAMYAARNMNIKFHMQFDANEKDVDRMFKRERAAKMAMMEKVSANRFDTADDYYEDAEQK